MRPRRPLLALATAAGVALIVPAAAYAHATPGIDYRFPLPIWLYALAGGIAVLASAPAAALGLGRRERNRLSGDLYQGALRRLHLRSLALAAAGALLALALVGGRFGADYFYDNPLTVLVWVDLWVGLGVVSALLGNVWDFVSPLSALGRALDRLLARRGLAARRYPAGLGLWPSVVLLLAWSWAELIWDEAKEPRTLLWLVLGYSVLQLVAMAIFGAEVWLARAEMFTVIARTLARFAPLELSVGMPAGPCRAERCLDEQRSGCPSCWLDADPGVRRLRLRAYGAGVHREPPLGAGGGTFVLALLATVIFDGFSQTERFLRVEGFFLDRGWLGFHVGTLDTLLMVAIAGGFALAFLAVCALVARREAGGTAAVARRYAPTLIPIAAVYFVSHYFLYLLYVGQFTAKVVLDPLHRDWIADYAIWTGFPGGLVWWIQVVLIVTGHVIAVFAVHRAAGGLHRRPRLALAAQAPLVLLMVGYTFSGLWVLGQILKAP